MANFIRRFAKKYLFARQINVPAGSPLLKQTRPYQQLVAVEAYTKDHAIRRLVERWPDSNPGQWEFIDDLDPEHFVGRLGTDLPLYPDMKGRS